MFLGKIIDINHRRGFFIVFIPRGDWLVFELLDSIDLHIDDNIQGEHPENLGHVILIHLDQKRKFQAYAQSGPSSLQVCKRMIL